MEALQVIEGFGGNWGFFFLIGGDRLLGKQKSKGKIELLSVLDGNFSLIRQTMKRNIQKILNFIEAFNENIEIFSDICSPFNSLTYFSFIPKCATNVFLRIKLKVSDQLALIKWKLFTTRPEKHVKNQSEILIACDDFSCENTGDPRKLRGVYQMWWWGGSVKGMISEIFIEIRFFNGL